MKHCVFALIATVLLSGCGTVPSKYEGDDAASVSGVFLAASKTAIVEINGQRRGPPYWPVPIKVKPGLVTVGLNVWNVSGQLHAFGCFEIDAAPASYHEFAAKTVDGGFDVQLYQGAGKEKKLIASAFVAFARPADRRCPVRSA